MAYERELAEFIAGGGEIQKIPQGVGVLSNDSIVYGERFLVHSTRVRADPDMVSRDDEPVGYTNWMDRIGSDSTW